MVVRVKRCACSGLQDSKMCRDREKWCEKRAEAWKRWSTTANFPGSRASNFRLACLYYLKAWHSLYVIITLLINWLTDWWIDLMIDWLIDWLIEWLIDWLIDWLSEWVIDWVVVVGILCDDRISSYAADCVEQQFSSWSRWVPELFFAAPVRSMMVSVLQHIQ